jgi:hypothetical protein
MNNAIQFEGRVSRSRSKHEGESSAEVCDRPGRTREVSQRQLPTDHDYAVPIREYQLDQSSPIPATAAADPVLEKTKSKTPQLGADVDGVTPYHFPIAGYSGATREIAYFLALKQTLCSFACPGERCPFTSRQQSTGGSCCLSNVIGEILSNRQVHRLDMFRILMGLLE